MKTKIIGSTLPVLEIDLQGNDKIVAEPGEFSWMSDAVQMKTTAFTAGSKGVWGALSRAFSGGGLFMTEYSAPPHGSGTIAFAAKVPGSILQVDVAAGQTYLIHRHGFLCATEGVQLGTGFQRSLGAGIFGGNGFVMQKLAGTCTAWVELGGEAVIYDLAPGETLRVHPGHVGMIEGSVNFDVAFMRGFANALFGGDGLFVARLTGPGRVWLQTLTVPNLAHALSPYLGGVSSAGEAAEVGAAGVAGAVLRGLFKS
ncbi:MAG: AIM24 family protein [Gammaproteobacteria bacterium]|nr:MAG: AIM24 family protein [Gammaproteobacteria bacterium]